MVDGTKGFGYTIRVTFVDMIDDSLNWHWVSYLPLDHELDCFKHINGIIYDVEVDHNEYVSVPETLIFKEMEMKAGLHPEMFDAVCGNDCFLRGSEGQ